MLAAIGIVLFLAGVYLQYQEMVLFDWLAFESRGAQAAIKGTAVALKVSGAALLLWFMIRRARR